MLKISKRSWHYRLYRYIRNIERAPEYLLLNKDRIDYDPPRSLCLYAWSIFLGLIAALVVGWIVAFVTLLVLLFDFVAWATKAAWERGRFTLTTPDRLEKAKKAKRKKEEKRPTVVAAFFKARKDKVCPVIELVD